MRILALETTERVGTAAALSDGNLLAEMELDTAQRSAQSLAPAMLSLLKKAQWRPEDVQLVAVSKGPGSFTGLRVGVTTAKVFAYAIRAEILGVDTLEAIAAASPDDVDQVSVVIDAQRGEVVARRFGRRPGGSLEPLEPERLVDFDRWLDELPAGMAVSGPILGKLGSRLPDRVRLLAADCWRPRAAAVGQLAARDYASGRRDDLWILAPHYCRRSAAEEKRGREDKATRNGADC